MKPRRGAEAEMTSKIPNNDAYFEAIESKKKLPLLLQESLTAAFAQIPVSSFPDVPRGQVIEIPGDTSVLDAVRILSENNIMAAPVTNPDAETPTDLRGRYLGIIDYAAVILWVLENAELAAAALAVGSATAAGVGTAAAGGMAAERGVAKDAPVAADHLGVDFYKVLLEEEPFKSTTVKSIVQTYRWAPFLPVVLDSSMLTVLLLLSKYRLRNVPVVEPDKPVIRNFITQTAIVQGLRQCEGRDWFDCIAALPLSDLGLPFMSYDEVVSINSDDLILEAFKRMRDNRIGGLPVIEGPKRKLVGNVSIRHIRFLLLRPDLFSNFRQLTVMDFIKTIGSSVQDSGNGNSMAAPPPTCAPDATLGSVIDSLASNSVHRIYVVEGDDCEVVGVVTLRDVISCFINEPPNYFDNYLGLAMEMLDGGTAKT
ncbi:SNF1-related protein kinase regulatory subunit gamma-1-like isoform X5 [Typha latifolia]|uniref:SNF1-related protein kinase regulatory subunit gamma-1-like isoform X5 n=2 Tax=Typha latifolia TaxID=4733 RepID=UPI003C2B95EC